MMKKLQISLLFISLAAFLCSGSAFGQIKMPRPSPMSTVTQDLGLMNITIEYSRPGMKDREIFGGLVPYDKVWRTGANASTKITFSDDVKVEGSELKAGKYAMLSVPGESEWEIIFNSNLKTNIGDYNAEENVLTIKVKPMKLTETVETFTIGVADIRDDHAHIELAWENTSVKFKVETEVDEEVMKQIEKQTAGVDPYIYYQSARYYYQTERDLNQALEWINKATADDQKFWMMRYKALILAGLGKYNDAIVAANRSTELAKEAGNEDYPRMNEASIKEWEAAR